LAIKKSKSKTGIIVITTMRDLFIHYSNADVEFRVTNTGEVLASGKYCDITKIIPAHSMTRDELVQLFDAL
jgi:hypothetical protein